MGLLTQILGGLLGGGRSPIGRGSGGGSSRVLMALLPIVLTMLANRRSAGAGTGGSITDRDGALVGPGGLGGLLERFTRGGLGAHAQSWVGTGPNQPITPDALSAVFGESQLSEIASRAGVTEEEARTGLSELLPEVVDHFTPDGQLPPDDQLLSSIDDFERQLQP